ncbi:MAG: peptidoglycan-associated lipoprotein Pal [Verrucomicrobia bacterium]|nr:peptidoglycan-associated lipoprotein Pal [Verrucomicrobiota bacterium]MBI3870910.1 peptidoglycan-associated lipoprotein Pal [Verrucomicrobiota bacterium]
MKKNISNFYRLVPVLLLIVLVSSGCSRRSVYGTAVPGRNTNVGDDGTGARPPRTIDNGPTIGPGTGGITPTPIPVVEGNVPNADDAGARDKWDNAIEDRSKFETQTVYFDYDKFNIKPTEVEKIRTVATHMKANAKHLVVVEGNCDERGTEEYNRALGERRAQAIREFLAREGVAPDRVRTISYGEDRPAENGHTEAAWSKNRRGVFVLMTPK